MVSSRPSAWKRLLARLSYPVNGAWLAAFRVAFGLTLCTSFLRFIAYGWIDRFFVEPSFRFEYWGLSWLPRAPAWALHGLFWGLAALALCVAAGFCFRVAACLLVVGFAYLATFDVALYLNHYYLALLLGLLLALSPAGRVGSLDARWFPRDATRRGARVTAGWLYLFRFQIGIVYTFAGLAKAHDDWLVHAEPLRIWLGARTHLPLIGPLFAIEGVPLAMSWAGFLFDSTVTLWLLWPKTRALAFAALVLFHALTSFLFPIGMFPVIMIVAALVFFEPGWPRGLLDRLGRLAGGSRGIRPDLHEGAEPSLEQSGRRALLPAHGSWSSTAASLAIVYAVLQLLMPLRFAWYGGNVRWHEQGMRFSWRVMVREKNGSVTFLVENPRSGRVFHVSPRRYLTDLQEREMSGQPDLILKLAHHVRDEFERREGGPVEVRVDAVASLNGRKLSRLIDPDVDLGRTKDGPGRADWILPAPDGPPPTLRPLAPLLARNSN